jgi:GAF domain-containing protein
VRGSDKVDGKTEIELAVTFADQAAIAIENVRLFDGVRSGDDNVAFRPEADIVSQVPSGLVC